MTYRILTLNRISPRGLARLPPERYEVGADIAEPDAILLRSADLHDTPIAPGVRAIGRAGVGVNNIPVADMSRRGIPVFNSPGANANAVKELVLAGLLLAARNIGPAWLFARDLAGDDEAIEAAVERASAVSWGSSFPGARSGWWDSARSASRWPTPPWHSACACSATIRRSPCSAPGSCRRASSRRSRSRTCSRAPMPLPCTCRSTSAPAGWSTRRAWRS